ncbi:plastocyanin/azurin family copper-binding protein [bacterium]|nr:plastocyanin/azurin family copper-binding protein [bacterium]
MITISNKPMYFFANKVAASFVMLLTIFFSIPALGADQTIEMLNKLGKENMVFSKKIVSVDIGDTVFWKSTKPGHNVEFIKGGVPEGVGKFRSAVSKDTEYKFDIPGIYAYWCTPHKGMGMIGFVVVGNDKSNLDAVKKIKYMGKSKKLALELTNLL